MFQEYIRKDDPNNFEFYCVDYKDVQIQFVD